MGRCGNVFLYISFTQAEMAIKMYANLFLDNQYCFSLAKQVKSSFYKKKQKSACETRAQRISIFKKKIVSALFVFLPCFPKKIIILNLIIPLFMSQMKNKNKMPFSIPNLKIMRYLEAS